MAFQLWRFLAGEEEMEVQGLMSRLHVALHLLK